MATDPEQGEIHELAGGWITERKGTPIPLFLKLSYVAFSIFGVVYLFRYVMGEVDHASRGPLVRQLNQATEEPSGLWIGFLAVCLIGFIGGLLYFAFGRDGKE